MRRTQSCRPESREANGREYIAECGREYGRSCGKNCGKNDRRKAAGADSENLYRELTKEGRRFCAAAGLLEEVIVLAAFGIRVSMSPLPVLAFLWVLFVILTAAALIGASCVLDRLAGLRPAPQPVSGYRCAKTAPVSRKAASGRRDCGTERAAA